MTEAEWQSSGDCLDMLAACPFAISARKSTLYICAGLRHVWDLLYDDSSKRAVETAERAADGLASDKDIRLAAYSAEVPTFCFDFEPEYVKYHHFRHGTYSGAVCRLLEMRVYSEADLDGGERLGDEQTRRQLLNAAHIAYHCITCLGRPGLNEHLLEHLDDQENWPGGWLIRELFGNPFREAVIEPAWLAWNCGTVPAIAQRIYDERSSHLMPVLGNSLEDAGCTDAQILEHCRSGGDHVRGCWVVDAVLGKE